MIEVQILLPYLLATLDFALGVLSPSCFLPWADR